MKHLPWLSATLLLVLVLTPPSALTPGIRARGTPLVMVVAANVPMQDIHLGTLRRAFHGEGAEYASGKRLIPINHPPGTATRVQFDLMALGLTPQEAGRFWIDRRIRDQPGPPRTVPTPELALRVVMSLPGAITYVPPEMVNPKVRALTIDGKSPGDETYLLD